MKIVPIATFILVTSATMADAQTSSHVWLTPAGSDANTCSQASPCRSLSQGITRVTDGGVIFIDGTALYGGGTLTKSAHIQGSYDGAHLGYLTINAPNRDVEISGIKIDGRSGWVSSGIDLQAARKVTLDTVRISSFNQVGDNLSGLHIRPGSATTLNLRNVSVTDSGTGSGAAIRIVTGGHNVNVSLENVKVSGGAKGIVIDAGAGGFAKVSIRDSTFANIAGLGIGAYSGTGNIRLYLDNVTSVNNTHGLVAHGARTIAWLGSSTIAGNSIGVLRQSGGTVQSYKDNYIFNNNTDGTPLSDSLSPPAATGTGGEVAAAGR